MDFLSSPYFWLILSLVFILAYLRPRLKLRKEAKGDTFDAYQSIASGSLIRLGLLMGQGEVDLHTSNAEGLNPIMFAAKMDRFKALALLLGKADSTLIDAVDPQGKTALIHACENGGVKSAALLIKSGANQRLTDKMGHSAQFYAAQKKNNKLLKLLEGDPIEKD